MEPFRPWVDRIVYRIIQENPDARIDIESKKEFLKLPGIQVLWQKKEMTFLVVSHLLAARLKQTYEDASLSLIWPEWSE